MATLYVRNFPDPLYETVKELARENDQSISAEVIALVSDAVARVQRKPTPAGVTH
jgi:plasmid stability protein